MNSDQLNETFGIEQELRFAEGEGGFIYAEIINSHAKARISIYAGQVLSYQPLKESEDLLFVSEKAYFQPGKAIKGGVPVCWPWFGNDPQDKGRPAHGFVRSSPWQVSESRRIEGGFTRLVLTAPEDEETKAQLQITIDVGTQLNISLTTTNQGDSPMLLTQALHTYFQVGDIASVGVYGLEGRSYIDKVDGMTAKLQDEPLRISSEVDRIYTGIEEEVVINDASLGRKIHITAEGSNSVVVWNPWIEKSAHMADFKDDDYLQMICVETANAGPDQVTVPAGESHRLQANYRISRGQ